jgi:hypothetical protein
MPPALRLALVVLVLAVLGGLGYVGMQTLARTAPREANCLVAGDMVRPDTDCAVEPPGPARAPGEVETLAPAKLTMRELFDETYRANAHLDALVDELNEHREAAHPGRGADLTQYHADMAQLEALAMPRINAAQARVDAIRDEMGRRCPGGASFHATGQWCGTRSAASR